MEDKITLAEPVAVEETKEGTHREVFREETPEIQPKRIKNEFKEKTCRVIAYNKKDNTLDVNFDGYGVRIKNVKNFSGDKATVKYKGEIGKPNFECKL